MDCSEDAGLTWVPLSALQHYAYCPRQCGLIHLEQVWIDNRFTVEGNALHQRVDRGEPENRQGVRLERNVLISAPQLGLTGRMDLLEVDRSRNRYTPVEYKRGRPKVENWDRIQVCAQALCLEEMLDVEVDEGILWYWKTRHREPVICDESLRTDTHAVIQSVKLLMDQALLPRTVATRRRCKACSLQDVCQPDLIRVDHSKKYFNEIFKE